MAITWHFYFRTYPNRLDPTFTTWAVHIERLEDSSLTDWHFTEIVDQDPLWTDPLVEIYGVSYDATSYRKWGVLSFFDIVGQERVYFPFDVYVPPFNRLSVQGQIAYSQSHVIAPEIPPIPPPTPPPPRPIPEKPEPPIEEPLEPEPEPPPPCGDLDAQTFREFWRQWGHQVDKLAFEVPLDDGVDVPDLPEPWRSVWRKLTHHRIDVVFSRKGSIYVAEIKPRLSIAAIGTAIVARTMFMRRYDVSRYESVKAAVISQVGSPTLIQAAATHRVVVFLTKGVDGLYEPVALHDVIW